MRLAKITNWPQPRYKLLTLSLYTICLFGFFIAAHESGSGFVQAMGALLLGMVLANFIMSFYILQKAEIKIISAPYDGTTGQALSIELLANKNIQLDLFLGGKNKIAIAKNTKTSLLLRPAHYGLLQEVSFFAFSSYPFGIIRLYRKINCNLCSPLHIAPLPLNPDGNISGGDTLDTREGALSLKSVSGDLRSLSPYRTGDAVSSISWPKSAQTQQMLVKVHENPQNYLRCKIKLETPSDRERAEIYLGEKLALIIKLIQANYELIIETNDAEKGMIENQVRSIPEAKRLIARSIATAPGT